MDAFLGGALTVAQPKSGYRAGVDPVLLAAAAPLRPAQTVLDLGCGVGTAGFCAARRVKDVQLYGVDIVPDHVTLAQENAVRNEIQAHFVHGDVCTRPTPFHDMSFDHVITNPPFFVDSDGTAAADKDRAAGRSGSFDMQIWIETAAKRLRPKGYLTLIQRMERLPDIIAGARLHFGSLEILPISARTGRAPNLFILRARKAGKAAFKMHVPMVMHKGAHHEKDGESYTTDVQSVLRHGAALMWPE
ncbi:MAG: tRNA1(Val) (adenine(37)-N6)-methyltransferase [Planktomarina sp.]